KCPQYSRKFAFLEYIQTLSFALAPLILIGSDYCFRRLVCSLINTIIAKQTNLKIGPRIVSYHLISSEETAIVETECETSTTQSNVLDKPEIVNLVSYSLFVKQGW